MKTKILYFIFFSSLFVSCSVLKKTNTEQEKHIELKGTVFYYSTEYMQSSFNFVSEDTCIYSQEFLCEMADAYKKFTIICKYEIKNNAVLLTNLQPIDSLKGLPPEIQSIFLPISELQKCEYMNLYEGGLEKNPISKYFSTDRRRIEKNYSLYGRFDYFDTLKIEYFNQILFYDE
jgi:hypothetical protein